MQDLPRRALVAVTLGPLTIFIIYLGGWFYFIPIAALLGIALFEFTQLMSGLGWRVSFILLIPLVFAQWILPVPVFSMLFPSVQISEQLVSVAFLASLLVILAFYLLLFEKQPEVDVPGSWMAGIAALVLIGWLGSHFFRLRGVDNVQAAAWTALAMIGTWIADSGAYVFGKSFGRHKLSPRLSPNKTIEGYIGGIIAGILITGLIGYFLKMPLVYTLILGVLISAVSPLGDLGISLLKRSVGVKDSGSLLPGHGGALDRIDSLLWSVAMAYYFVLLVSA